MSTSARHRRDNRTLKFRNNYIKTLLAHAGKSKAQAGVRETEGAELNYPFLVKTRVN